MPSSSAAQKVLVIALEEPELFMNTQAHLIRALKDREALIFVDNEASALQHLSSALQEPTKSPFSAVMVADAAIVTEFPAVRAAITEFATNAGGRVLLGALFPSFVAPPNFDAYMRTSWNLPWRFGDYYRTDFHLNPLGKNLCLVPGMPNSYSMKAVSLSGVSDEASVIYRPTKDSVVQSLVFAPEKVDSLQAAIAFGRVGRGWLGWVGDVNGEEETTKVILAMAGLID
ncbi:hypothetical protein BDZ91DRAFT_766669 [Kalaharituber pfeilii]|nr:hypothetical protein BDZ91DRAFT_766669 [Kalaharituber pfeilii]